MKICLVLFLTLMTLTVQAVPEKNYSETWEKEVSPYFAKGQQRTYINQEGLKLNYYSFTGTENKKTIVILPGRTEPAAKYAELVYDLKDSGFNIYVIDHQGQGASERRLADTHKGYVKHFDDYVCDLSGWLDEVVVPETEGQDRYLIAHSMGGTIATMYLANGKPVFKKAVLSCPMMQINTKPYKENIGRLLTSVLVLALQGKKYAPDRGPYLPEADTFEKNEVTHSKVRFEMSKALFVNQPELALGGPTSRWVNQSLKATKKIDDLAEKIKIPVLFFQSGLDLIVQPGRQNSFCERSSNCRKVHFANGHHEILQETDYIRDQAIGQIKTFINN